MSISRYPDRPPAASRIVDFVQHDLKGVTGKKGSVFFGVEARMI